MHALERSLHVGEQVGAYTAVVDTFTDQASALHRHFGFIAFEDKPRRAHLPIAEILTLSFG